MDWNSFNLLSNSLTCENTRKLHGDSLYLLPSKAVLEGFSLNPNFDVSSYCDILEDCLSGAEKALIGC